MSGRSRRAGRASTVVVWLLIAFLYLPLLAVSVFAFNSGTSLSLPFRGFSLRWFRALVDDPAFGAAFTTSAKVAAITAICAAVIGSFAAYLFVRRRAPLLTMLEVTSRLPVMVPPLLLGIGLLTTIDLLGLTPSLATVTVGHLVYVIPFVVVVVVARIRSLDAELELAARDLGAGPVETLRRVTVPIVLPAVLAAAAIGFAFSFDEVLITTFTVGQQSTLPLYVVSRLRRTIDPSINAVAFIMIVVPWIALGVAAVLLRGWLRRQSRRTARISEVL